MEISQAEKNTKKKKKNGKKLKIIEEIYLVVDFIMFPYLASYNAINIYKYIFEFSKEHIVL